jgi:hypothetical protein
MSYDLDLSPTLQHFYEKKAYSYIQVYRAGLEVSEAVMAEAARQCLISRHFFLNVSVSSRS